MLLNRLFLPWWRWWWPRRWRTGCRCRAPGAWRRRWWTRGGARASAPARAGTQRRRARVRPPPRPESGGSSFLHKHFGKDKKNWLLFRAVRMAKHGTTSSFFVFSDLTSFVFCFCFNNKLIFLCNWIFQRFEIWCFFPFFNKFSWNTCNKRRKTKTSICQYCFFKAVNLSSFLIKKIVFL